MTVEREYPVHLDDKKRVTLQGANCQYYNVREYDNGCILLEPREPGVPDTKSAKTLKDMDQTVSNYKTERVSKPLDLSDF